LGSWFESAEDVYRPSRRASLQLGFQAHWLSLACLRQRLFHSEQALGDFLRFVAAYPFARSRHVLFLLVYTVDGGETFCLSPSVFAEALKLPIKSIDKALFGVLMGSFRSEYTQIMPSFENFWLGTIPAIDDM
jgi:hypothetical protein